MTPRQLSTVAIAPGSELARGFTLIELMITVVIATILMSIAIPLYQHQVREGRRTDARTALADLATREEQYYAINNAYTNAANALGYTSWPQTVGGGYYKLRAPSNINAATANAAATYTLTAVPVAGKGQDKDTDCAVFQVTQAGQQTSLNSALADSTPICWN